MGFINNYPYTDFHELNLDWVLNEIKTLHSDWNDFKVLNTITFSGDWNITRQYPAWTIVDGGNDVGYISIKPVPSGISLTNEDYWRIAADYSALMAGLQARIIALESKMSRIEHKNIICIGDSYLAYTYEEMESSSWGAFLRIFLGDNADVTLNGLGGAGFVGNAAETFQQLLEDVNVEDNNAITDIIVIGGLNDGAAVATGRTTNEAVNTAISSFISRSYELYPNAKVSIGFAGWMTRGFDGRDTYLPYIQNMIEVYKKCIFNSRHGNVAYINNIEYVMPIQPTSAYKSDKIHPTASTSSIIGMHLANYILTGASYSPIKFYNKAIVTPSGIVSSIVSGGNNVDIVAEGDSIVISGLIGTNTVAGTEIAPLTYEYELGSFEEAPIRACSARPLEIGCTAVIFPGKSGVYDCMPAKLIVRNGLIKLVTMSNVGLGNYTNVTHLNVYIPTSTYKSIFSC